MTIEEATKRFIRELTKDTSNQVWDKYSEEQIMNESIHCELISQDSFDSLEVAAAFDTLVEAIITHNVLPDLQDKVVWNDELKEFEQNEIARLRGQTLEKI